MIAVYWVARCVSALLGLLQVAMLVRAILSWFPGAANSPFGDFIATLTEPIIGPVRAMCDRFGWFRNTPIDFSFIIAYLILILVQSFLSSCTSLFF